MPAGDEVAVDRAATAAIEREVPAIALEDERGFVAMPGEHMAVDLVEAGVGAAAFEPAVVGGLAGVEGAGPGHGVGRQVCGDGGERRCIPADEHAGFGIADQPGIGLRVEPVQRGARDLAMEGTRIGTAGGAHGFPVCPCADGIDLCA